MTICMNSDKLLMPLAAFRSQALHVPSAFRSDCVCLSGWSWLAPRSKTKMQMKPPKPHTPRCRRTVLLGRGENVQKERGRVDREGSHPAPSGQSFSSVWAGSLIPKGWH